MLFPLAELTKSSCHGLVQGGLAVPRGQVWAGVVPALVVVVFYIEARELGEVDAQRAAGVVDVLSIQRLRGNKTSPHPNAVRPNSQQWLPGERVLGHPTAPPENRYLTWRQLCFIQPLWQPPGCNSLPLTLCPWGNVGVSPP